MSFHFFNPILLIISRTADVWCVVSFIYSNLFTHGQMHFACLFQTVLSIPLLVKLFFHLITNLWENCRCLCHTLLKKYNVDQLEVIFNVDYITRA